LVKPGVGDKFPIDGRQELDRELVDVGVDEALVLFQIFEFSLIIAVGVGESSARLRYAGSEGVHL